MYQPSASGEEVVTNAMDRSQERPLLQVKQISEKDSSSVNKVSPANNAPKVNQQGNGEKKQKHSRIDLTYEDD